ncbi:MAG: single-stranded DNA-binding protein [bacterium]
MSSLNKAMIIGNLTRDPEMRQTGGGRAVCNFGVATNRRWNNPEGERKEEVEYHNVVAWGKLAEICGQYLVKGKKVFIEGRLQTRDWEGQDGVRRYRTEIVAENMVMLDRSGAPGGGGGGYGAQASGGYNAQPSGGYGAQSGSGSDIAPPIMDEPSANPDDEIKIEDIPF